jgi:CheY-like chemotaxis protein
VLVVDDDVGVGRLLGLILQEDHDVVVAASGQEALARIAVRVPDVVLSDLMMPGMTGIELHAAIAASHPALARRMLFTTGGAYTPETQAFVTAMGERVLAKPVSVATIRAAVAAVIASPG